MSRVVGEVFYDHAGNRCYLRENGTLCVTTVNEDPSLTIQSERDNCDINKVLARFKTTGVMTNINTRSPIQGDFSGVSDYQSAVNQVMAAEEAFMALPAALRKRFDNDPGKMLAFVDDPQNASEAVSLGLVEAVPQDYQIPQGAVSAVETPQS